MSIVGDRPAGECAEDAGNAADPLAEAFDAFGDRLYRHALMILADPAGAEDAVQQAFVKLVGMSGRGQGLGRGQGRGRAAVLHEGYLRAAVRNECYRMLRRRRRNLQPLESAALLEAVRDWPGDADRRLAIERALRQLPPEQREVIHLKVYEGMTFQRISEALGVSINTVASRYRYAAEKLRNLLAPMREES